MIQKLKTNKILWAISALAALGASVVGLVNPEIYKDAEPLVLVPGSFAQDIMTIPTALVLLFLAIKTKDDNYKKQIVAIGLIGYLFYAYGLYVIGQLFTPYYLLYMAVFTISFYSLIFSLVQIDRKILNKLTISKGLRRFSIGLAFLQPVVFYPLWAGMLISQINSGKNVDFISVFIVDLCFIMPAFIIAAILAKKNNPFGYISLTALFVLAFVELAPLGVGEIIKPSFGMTVDPFFMVLFSVLSILFLTTGILNLKNLKLKNLEKNEKKLSD